jgi:Domain of unknown function (DUF4389)
MEAAPTPVYPATLDVEPGEHIANWRPLVHWLLVIPHLIVLNVLGLAAGIVGIIAWFAILFTGRLPQGLAGFQALYIRYANRTFAYEWFMREEYPPFAFDMEAADPGQVAGVRTDLDIALEGRNRLTTAFRWILAIPHFVVLTFLAIATYFVVLVAFFVVLFTGHWPVAGARFAEGFLRWNTRLSAYVFLLTDAYPPFTMA